MTFTSVRMDYQAKGKVALVTGGASGIGYCISRELLKHGLEGVAVLDVDVTKGEAVKNEFTKEFGENSCIFIKTDVSQESQMEEAFKLTVETFKQLDIVINNAGVVSELNWKKCLDINLGGCIIGTKLAIDTYLPKYKSGSEGLIINVASKFGLEPNGQVPVYSATKSGVIALGRAYGVKEHYERTKVKVLTICPGRTVTSLISKTNLDNEISRDYLKYFKNVIQDLSNQEPEFLAKSVIDILKKTGESGSVWVVEEGQPPYQIEL